MKSIAVSCFLAMLLYSMNQSFVSCKQGSGSFSKRDALKFLKLHNMNRGLALPSATNMNFVTWSTTLEALATLRSKLCKVDERVSAYGNYKGVDQNYFFGNTTDPEVTMLAWMEQEKYHRRISANSSHCLPGCDCRSYANIMSSALTEIGCGFSKCGDKDFLSVCLYSHHYDGQEIYKIGPVCSECPKERPFCFFDLCVTSETIFADANERGVTDHSNIKMQFRCKLSCKNCGLLVTSVGGKMACYCDCTGAFGTGHLCEIRNSSAPPNSSCSFCSAALTCLNGGTLHLKPPCGCSCPAGFSGLRCEWDDNKWNNSISMDIGRRDLGNDGRVTSWPEYPDFYSSIWPCLQRNIAKYVTADCKSSKASLAKCCSRDNPTDFDKLTGKINATQVELNQSSVERNANGWLHFTFSLLASDSSMCFDSLSTAAAAVTNSSAKKYVPREILLTALQRRQVELSKAFRKIWFIIQIKSITPARGPNLGWANFPKIVKNGQNDYCIKLLRSVGQIIAINFGDVCLVVLVTFCVVLFIY